MDGLRTANWPLYDVAFDEWRKSDTMAVPRPPLQPVTMKDPFWEDMAGDVNEILIYENRIAPTRLRLVYQSRSSKGALLEVVHSVV